MRCITTERACSRVARAAVGLLSLVSVGLGADSSLLAPSVAVGNRLETSGFIRLSEPAVNDNLRITLHSSDSKRLLLATKPDAQGADSISLRVPQGFSHTPEFWLQGLDSTGSVSYTAEAPGYAASIGTVTLWPSGIALVGPFKAEKFLTTTGGEPTPISLYSVRLDASMKYAEEQLVGGGGGLQFSVTTNAPSIGRVESARGTIAAGASTSAVLFKPSGEGEAVLRVDQPAGLHTPEPFATLTACVHKPGLAISTELYVGNNLEVGGVLALGEKAHRGGVTVTLTSDDPAKLLLSNSATDVGAKSITVTIPENETATRYYIQALSSSGTVKYTAAAPGFETRTAVIGLAPSGILITPSWQGPPDEAQLFRPGSGDDKYRFLVKLSQAHAIKLVVWTAQLDPATHRAADITIQPLRAGISATVRLISGEKTVADATPSVTIQGGTDHAVADFSAFKVGTIEVSVETPREFTPSANSTAVVATILK